MARLTARILRRAQEGGGYRADGITLGLAKRV